MYKKASSKKLYLAILLIVIIAVSAAAIVYATQSASKAKSVVVVGVKVGDTFTYNITGESTLGSSDANPDSEYPGFASINGTFLTVTITQISDPIVSFTLNWMWSNGTKSQDSQWLNISSGAESTQNGGFWMIYPANLKINDLTRPDGFDGVKVNDTGTQPFGNENRTICYFGVSDTFTDTRDPTGNTQQRQSDYVYFDQQTGMLDTLTEVQQYNNPQMTLAITWELTSSSVWQVSS